jgi:hypothetical protein
VITLDEIRAFLPTFLSHGSETAFLDEIKHFLTSESRPFYTEKLAHQPILFQGDGLEGLLVVNLPDTTFERGAAMLLSNTCDVSPYNKRLFASSLTYAPIFRLDGYLAALREGRSGARVDENAMRDHESKIRQQLITQIFYLPKGGLLPTACIVFLDRAISVRSETVNRDDVPKVRLFTLSDFGAWLFALKLSIHFCRIRDKVDRMAGTIA